MGTRHQLAKPAHLSDRISGGWDRCAFNGVVLPESPYAAANLRGARSQKQEDTPKGPGE